MLKNKSLGILKRIKGLSLFCFQKVKKTAVITVLLAFCNVYHIKSQDKIEELTMRQSIGLQYVLSLAGKHSLDAFKSKRKYGVNYWQFKSFQSSLLPKISFETRPLTFNRSLVKRYDSEVNIDVFRQQQSLSSYANVSMTQNIRATGTSLFINSNFDRIINSGLSDVKSYSATPIRIGLIQPLMAYNRFKWEKETEPLEYQIAKQEFIHEQQAINIKTIDYFFSWALAYKRVEIAEEKKLSTARLLKIGKKRYDLGAIERDDLLNLELDVYNANTNQTQNLQSLQKAETALRLFLRDQIPGDIQPELPELISDLQINIEKAKALAQANNPDILDLKLRKIEASRDLDKTIKDNRFDLSVTASYGLNQQGNTLIDAYGNLLDQQMVSVNFSLPILDWGERKGKIKTAQMNKDVIDIELQQDADKLDQDIAQKVIDFNLQKELVQGTLKTSEIAKESYNITEKRFLSGKIDLLNLTSSRKVWQQATEQYIQSLFNYWRLYYEVQQLTLYNFIKDKPIVEDFDAIAYD